MTAARIRFSIRRGVATSFFILLAAMVSSAQFAETANAQTPPLANVPGTNPIIFGVPVFCNDANGTPVSFVFGNINQLALSQITPQGAPIMVFSPTAMTTPRPLLLFFYAHECSHHTLGHLIVWAQTGQMVPTAEPDADCNAATLVQQQGLLSQQDITTVANSVFPNPHFPPMYPAGPIRAQHILDCYNASAQGQSPPPPPPLPY